MADTTPESVTEPASDRLQLVAAIILGVAAVLTAFSAYTASELGGAALRGYTTSTRRLSDANAFYAQANQTKAIDQQLFLQYEVAIHTNDATTLGVVEKLISPDLRKGIKWWESHHQVGTPFDDASPYGEEDYGEARHLETQADRIFKRAVADDDQSGRVELATLTFALTLFFAGVATLFKSRAINLSLLIVSVITLAAGAVQLATSLS